MAEVIGFATGIIALIQLAGKVTCLSYGYIGGVKQATSDLHELADALGSLSKVLITVQNYIDKNPKSTALEGLSDRNGLGPLRKCTEELEELKSKLEPKGGFKGVMDNLKWPLKEKETIQHIARFERLKTLFILAVTADQITLSKEIEAHVQHTNSVVQELQIESMVQKAWREKEDMLRMGEKLVEKRKKVLGWLYPGRFDQKHLEINNRRQADTGKWLLGHLEFQNWIQGKLDPSFLWGRGIPGAGKTFLCSFVIDHLQAQASTEGYGVAYVYFEYQEQDTQKPTQILASLVKQLSTQTTHLTAEVEALYDELASKDMLPSFDELNSALLATLGSFSRVFFVFDALDECQEKQRGKLLPLFQLLSDRGASIFLTSRPHPEDIQDALYDIPRMELSAMEEDIYSYVEAKINKSPRAKRLVRQGNFKDKIVSELIDCAKGMFLIVHFHIEHLCQQTTARQILSELEKLKSFSNDERPLDPTYDRAMENLLRQPKSCIELAVRVLIWLAKTKRTLTVQELQIAVSIVPKKYELAELDLPDKTTLLDVCTGLVTIDENSDTIRLTHYTVQEYIIRNCVIPRDAEVQVAIACTTYLSFDIFLDTSPSPKEPDAPSQDLFTPQNLFDYVADHLSTHLISCDQDLTVDIFLEFFGSLRSSAYLEAYYPYLRGTPPLCNHDLLDLASAMGHVVAVRVLIENGADINSQNYRCHIPLLTACAHGHEGVVELLLKSGSDLSVHSFGHGAFHQTALHIAAVHGSVPIAKLLLTTDIELFERDHWDKTALDIAVDNGDETLFKLLVEKGGKSLIRDSGYAGETALHKAVKAKKFITMVKLLLDNGSDPLAIDNNGRTPLHSVAEAAGRRRPADWNKTIVELLLKLGNSLFTTDKQGRTALHAAAQASWNEAMVNLLLEKGSNLLAIDNEGQTVLHIAAGASRNEATVKLLLEKGSNLLATDNYGRTALHIAAGTDRNKATVKFLVEKGSDLLAIDNDGKTALHIAASFCWYEGTIKLLLGSGSNPSTKDNEGKTVLHIAAGACLSGDVFKLLLENVDHLDTDNNGDTALHIAAAYGDTTTIELLLEKGSNLSTRNIAGLQALHIAVTRGSIGEEVKLLLDNGSDPLAIDNEGNTALHIAATIGIEYIIKLLLEKGCDPLATNNSGETALHIAALKGDGDTVKVLLENGCSHSAIDKRGRTALHIAAGVGEEDPCYFQNRSVIQSLLEGGSNPLTVDNEGNTAMQIAEACSNKDAIMLLLEHDSNSFDRAHGR